MTPDILLQKLLETLILKNQNVAITYVAYLSLNIMNNNKNDRNEEKKKNSKINTLHFMSKIAQNHEVSKLVTLNPFNFCVLLAGVAILLKVATNSSYMFFICSGN
uniref:Uncharacterized protein n=1 Tax=Glossina brevipalpis TaxID=37001 RepID=A0A1A9WGQ9_9MUSC